jgi:hypothetical protein
MEDSKSDSVQAQRDEPSYGFYEKFIKGEFGLAKTYWLGGVVTSFIVNIAVRLVSSNTLAYSIGAAFLIYLGVLLVAIWNAGRKYSGSRIWPILAFLLVLMGLLRNIGPVLDMGRV